MIYLVPYGEWRPETAFFEFDATLSVNRRDPYKLSQYAIEAQAEVSDFVVAEPVTYSLKGIVSAWMASDGQDVSTRLQDVHGELIRRARDRQPVSMVSDLWSDDVLISSVDAKIDASSGEMLDISISLQTFQIAEYLTTEVPPDLLAPDVADSGSQALDGGAGSGVAGAEEFDPGSKTGAAALYDGENPFDALSAGIDTLS